VRLRWAALLVVLVLVGCQQQPPSSPLPPLMRGILSFGKPVENALAENESRWFFSGGAGDIISVTYASLESGITSAPPITLMGENGEAVARTTNGKLTNARLPRAGQYIVVIGAGSGKYRLTVDRLRSGDAPTPTDPPTPTSPPPGRPISLGKPEQGSIETGDSITLWAFQVSAGQTVTIRMEAQSKDLIPVVRLLGPDRALLASDENPRRAAVAQIGGFALPTGGVYFIQTWGNGQIGDYTLSVAPGIPLPTATATLVATRVASLEPTMTPTITPTILVQATFGAALRIGEPVRGQIQSTDQVDRFAVFTPAGTVISLGMFPDAGSALIPAFDVYAPNGDKILTAEGVPATDPADVRAGGAIVSGFTTPVTGAYVIFAKGNGAKSAFGAYTLIVGPEWTLREVGGGSAQINETFRGQLYRSGDRETWRYQLPANATIRVAASADSAPFNPVVEVVGPDGAQLAAVRGGPGGTAEVPSLVTPKAGEYLVRITSLKNESAGQYTMTLKQINVEPTPTFSPVDATLTGSVQQGERYSFTIQAKVGDIVRIEVLANDPAAFDPVLELYSPSGKRIARADDIGPGNTDAIVQIAIADETGDYRMEIHGYAMMPGSFKLHIVVTGK